MSGAGPFEARRDGFTVSDDQSRLDLDTIHRFIGVESYWAAGIRRETLERAIRHSLCFGLYGPAGQAGFARVVTDRTTFGYLCDVYVDAALRGRGLGKWLVACVLAHPDLQGLRRLCLMTRDAHTLYEPFGFRPMPDPVRYLEIHRPRVYEESPA